MSEEFQRELCFLIAKYLKTLYPDVADMFIQRCEENAMFPARVFSKSATFIDLDHQNIVPEDQLIRLIQLSCPKSKYPSLFFSPASTINPRSVAEVLLSKVTPPVNPFFNFGFRTRIVGHFDDVYCLAPDLSSQILVTGSDDGQVKMWRIPGLRLLNTIRVHENVISDLSIHPSNQFFAAASHDFTISIHRMLDGEQVKVLDSVESIIHTISYSPCGRYLAAGYADGYVRIYDCSKDYILIDSVPSISKEMISWVRFSPGGDFIVFSAEPTILSIYCMSTREFIQLPGLNNSADYVQFSRHSPSKLYSLSPKEKCLRLWICRNGLWDQHLHLSARLDNGIKQKLIRVDWNSDDSRLVGVASHALFIWDSENGKVIGRIQKPNVLEQVTVVTCHPTNPNIVFVGTSTGIASLWDINTCSQITSFTSEIGRSFHIIEAVWSADGRSVYAGDSDGGIIEIYSSIEGGFKSGDAFFGYEMESPTDLICDITGLALTPQPPPPEPIIHRKVTSKVEGEGWLIERWLNCKSVEKNNVDNPKFPTPTEDKFGFIDESTNSENEDVQRIMTQDESDEDSFRHEISNLEEIPALRIQTRSHANQPERIMTRRNHRPVKRFSEEKRRKVRHESNDETRKSGRHKRRTFISNDSDDEVKRSTKKIRSFDSESDLDEKPLPKTKVAKRTRSFDSESDLGDYDSDADEKPRKLSARKNLNHMSDSEDETPKKRSVKRRTNHISDSEDEIEEKPKRRLIKTNHMSDSEDETPKKRSTKRRTNHISDSEDDTNSNHSSDDEEVRKSDKFILSSSSDDEIPRVIQQQRQKDVSSTMTRTVRPVRSLSPELKKPSSQSKGKQKQKQKKKVNDFETKKRHSSRIDPSLRRVLRSFLNFLEGEIEKDENVPFLLIRDDNEIKKLKESSLRPMDLILLKDRVAEQYYETVGAIETDVLAFKKIGLALPKLKKKDIEKEGTKIQNKLKQILKDEDMD